MTEEEKLGIPCRIKHLQRKINKHCTPVWKKTVSRIMWHSQKFEIDDTDLLTYIKARSFKTYVFTIINFIWKEVLKSFAKVYSSSNYITCLFPKAQALSFLIGIPVTICL